MKPHKAIIATNGKVDVSLRSGRVLLWAMSLSILVGHSRLAFSHEERITQHAVLTESVSCMFCHLEVTGSVGVFEDFRPGFDSTGSGHTSRIRGTVYSTYNMASNSTRNANTTNADGTSKNDFFPFAGINYSTATDETINGFAYKYNPHWRTNIYPRDRKSVV